MQSVKELLAASRGERPCDLLIRGGRVANVLSMEYESADIAVHDGVIVGVGGGYEGRKTVDASGCVLMPGMIDGHLHIESTMLTPAMFASMVLPLGTTTIMPDPHEIANTCGLPGLEFMWRDSLRTPLDVFFGAPSCVPASGYETPFREMDAQGVADCYDRGWCTHLGEMMNVPGVVSGDPEVWGKIAVSRDRVRTAHLPSVTGRDLCSYLLSGCDGDHESNFVDEAMEKLRRGAWVMMREGATENNLEELAAIIVQDEVRFARCMAVSDDLTVGHVLRNGHMDHKLRILIRKGVRPLVAAALVTINPAQYFRMWDRGAIAPGKIADIVMVESLEACRAKKVWKRGRLVAEEGRALFGVPAVASSALPGGTPFSATVTEDAFRVPARPGRRIRAIRLLPGKVLTEQTIEEPTERDGAVVSDPARDVLKMVVVEKNRGSGEVAVGFVRGLGLEFGAIASSVAHDAHNFMAIGADDGSIATALNCLIRNGGGLAASRGSEIIASLPLPVGGLMSLMNPGELAGSMERMESAARELGTTVQHPFMAVSFLSLSVIPELKLTDRGYVNLGEGGVLDLFV